MKVNFITELFLPHIGGQEIRYARFGYELVKRGYNVFVYTINYLDETDLDPIENYNGIKVLRLFEIPGYIKNYSRKKRGLLQYAIQLNSFLKRNKNFEVTIINEMPIFHILYNCRLLRKKEVILDWAEHWRSPFSKPIFRHIIKCASKHIVINKFIYNYLLSYGVDKEHICYIPPALNLEKYKSNKEIKKHKLFIYVGRLTKHKHINKIIKAFSIIVNNHRDFHFLIIGNGPEKERLKALVKHLNLERNIFFLKNLDENMIISFLKRSYGFILASEREGFSWAVLEALASGTPVITVNYPNNYAFTLVKESKGGLVVSPTPQAIASAIEKFLDDYLWNFFHENALKYSKKFDIKNIIDSLIRFMKYSE